MLLATFVKQSWHPSAGTSRDPIDSPFLRCKMPHMFPELFLSSHPYPNPRIRNNISVVIKCQPSWGHKVRLVLHPFSFYKITLPHCRFHPPKLAQSSFPIKNLGIVHQLNSDFSQRVSLHVLPARIVPLVKSGLPSVPPSPDTLTIDEEVDETNCLSSNVEEDEWKIPSLDELKPQVANQPHSLSLDFVFDLEEEGRGRGANRARRQPGNQRSASPLIDPKSKSYQSFENQTVLSDLSPIHARETVDYSQDNTLIHPSTTRLMVRIDLAFNFHSAHDYRFAGAKPFIHQVLAKFMNAHSALYVSRERIRKGLQLYLSKLTKLDLNSQNYSLSASEPVKKDKHQFFVKLLTIKITKLIINVGRWHQSQSSDQRHKHLNVFDAAPENGLMVPDNKCNSVPTTTTSNATSSKECWSG
ncbi:hypothetical protein PSTT_01002, partial [Puccinia striiformis]